MTSPPEIADNFGRESVAFVGINPRIITFRAIDLAIPCPALSGVVIWARCGYFAEKQMNSQFKTRPCTPATVANTVIKLKAKRTLCILCSIAKALSLFTAAIRLK